MKQSTMEAYAEVDSILELMDSKYVMEIPEQLRDMFKEKKASNYQKKIIANKPLQEQNLNQETLEILAVLDYNYWCKDEDRKKELLNIYYQNDIAKEEALKQKYNIDNLFKNKEITDIADKKENNSNEVAMVQYNESIFKKIWNRILGMFKKVKA